MTSPRSISLSAHTEKERNLVTRQFYLDKVVEFDKNGSIWINRSQLEKLIVFGQNQTFYLHKMVKFGQSCSIWINRLQLEKLIVFRQNRFYLNKMVAFG